MWTRYLAPADAVRAVVEPDAGGRPLRLALEDKLLTALCGDLQHDRFFEATDDGTRFVDQLTFTPASAGNELIARAVRRVFVRRHRGSARSLPSDDRATGVAVLRQVLEHELAEA